MNHSSFLAPSLWRVRPVTSVSQTDMPSLTSVALDKRHAFKCKRTIHTKSISSSSPSFLDITPALQQYLSSPLSFTHFSSIPFSCTPPLMQNESPKETVEAPFRHSSPTNTPQFHILLQQRLLTHRRIVHLHVSSTLPSLPRHV